MIMKKYYLPYGWLFATRASKFDIFNICTIFINYALASFLFLFIYFEGTGRWILDYFIGFTGMMSLYECGYIFNDVVTTQYENSPTQRIKNARQKNEMLRHLENLLTIRFIYFFLASYWIYVHKFENLLIYVFLSVGLLVSYSLHNYIRSGWNGITFFILVQFKYFVPISIFLSVGELLYYYVWISIVAVFEQSILHWSEKEYFSYVPVLKENVERFRVEYFFVVTILFMVIIYFKILDAKYIVLPAIYLVYRIIGMLSLKNKYVVNMVNKRRNMHK